MQIPDSYGAVQPNKSVPAGTLLAGFRKLFSFTAADNSGAVITDIAGALSEANRKILADGGRVAGSPDCGNSIMFLLLFGDGLTGAEAQFWQLDAIPAPAVDESLALKVATNCYLSGIGWNSCRDDASAPGQTLSIAPLSEVTAKLSFTASGMPYYDSASGTIFTLSEPKIFPNRGFALHTATIKAISGSGTGIVLAKPV